MRLGLHSDIMENRAGMSTARAGGSIEVRHTEQGGGDVPGCSALLRFDVECAVQTASPFATCPAAAPGGSVPASGRNRGSSTCAPGPRETAPLRLDCGQMPG